jgi:hypothetical protein
VRTPVATLALIGQFPLLSAACSSLTEVDAPDVVQPASLENAVGAVSLYAGAVRDFSGAFAGTVTLLSGTLADELLAGGQTTFIADVVADARRLPETSFPFAYATLHAVRIGTGKAISGLQRFAPTPRSRIGQLFSMLGFVELTFAEQYCSGVPMSNNVDGQLVYGEQITTAAMYQLALSHFDSALAYSTDSIRFASLARVGKARTLLGLGRFSDAAAAVSDVLTTFRYDLELTAAVAGQMNIIYQNIFFGRTNGVADREGGVGLNFRTANDPRVQTSFVARAADGFNDIYLFTRYNSLSASFTLANGIEARLIEAEAALQANRNDSSPTGSGWLGILNTLRSTQITPPLPALADPGTFDARVDLLFRERAFWTFLTNHRLGDLRRLIRQYGRTQDKVFPTGLYKDGVPYGTDVNFSIVDQERNNPLFRGCLDRTA